MNINKKKLRKVLYVYGAIILILLFFSKTIYNYNLPKVTAVIPEGGQLIKELELRGVVAFSETFELYAGLNGHFTDIRVKKGDLIDARTVIGTMEADIAEQTLAIERINNQLASLYLSKTALEGQLRSLSASPSGGLTAYQNAVEDAQIALDKRQTELLEAQALVNSAFDGYIYQQAIDEALLARGRAQDEWAEARQALADLEVTEEKTFDDFIYQQNITETSVALERRQTELADAEAALEAAKRARGPSFDSHAYQNAIDNARIAYDRRLEDYNESFRQNDYTLIIQASRAVDDASKALDDAIDEMERASANHQAANGEAQKDTAAAAERQLTLAQNAEADARRANDNTVTELEHAQENFITQNAEARQEARAAAEATVTDARFALDEAERLYNIAVENRDRAAADNTRALLDTAAEAEENVNQARRALERAQDNLNRAQLDARNANEEQRRTTELERQNLLLTIENTRLDLRAATAGTAGLNGNTQDITADRSGIVVSVDKKAGQPISGGERIAVLGVDNGSFEMEVACPAGDGRFIELDDEAALRINGVSAPIKAYVTEIALEGETLRIKLACESDELKGGEYAAVRFNKRSEPYDVLVPGEAVYSDGFGYYVWVIRSRPGVLGIEYYAAKVKVTVADKDAVYAAVTRGLEYDGPVVTSFSRELSVNGTVIPLE